MTETWTLTGSLADFGLDPVAGASVVVTHDPPVWVDDAGDRLLVREEREPVADDGTFTIELAVTGGNYRVATTPRSLFSPFRFPSPDGGSHALHDLYLAHHGVPVPSPGAPLVKGDPGEPGASVVGGRDNGDGTISFELSDGTWTAPVPVPTGSGGTGAVSSVNGATGEVVLDAADVGALPSTYTPPAQSWADVTEKPATFPPTIGTTETTAKAGDWLPAWADVTDKPETFAPTAHAATHATGGSDPITPASIGASQVDHGHAAATITDLTETVQDIVGALIKAGTGTTVSYDDAAGTVTITATATGGSTDPEIVRDVIGSAMVAGSGIQITVNDAGDTITIASTAVLPTRKVIAGTGLTGGGDLSADRTLSVSYGTTEGTAAQGNDARLSDARTPTEHTHAAGDVTSGTFAPARLGTGTPSASTVLYGDGSWKPAPSGGGGSSSRELEGTGSPEGVIAASPGVYYTDQSGTNGAWRWLKRTGTGTTGWSVIYGDTGWRSIPMVAKSDSEAGVSSMTFLLRITSGGIFVKWTAVTTATVNWQLWAPNDSWVQANVLPGLSGTVARLDSHNTASITWESRQNEPTPRKVVVKPMSSLVAGTWEGRASAAPPNSWPATLPGSPA